MAAPYRNRNKPDDAAQAKTRQSIKTTQLVKRLQCYGLGIVDDAGNVVDLEPNRRQAIVDLLKKTLPDLSQQQVDTNMNVSFNSEDLMRISAGAKAHNAKS